MELLDDDQDPIAGARDLAAGLPSDAGADRLGLARLLEVGRGAQRVAGVRVGVGQLAARVQDDGEIGERLGPDPRSDRSLASHRLEVVTARPLDLPPRTAAPASAYRGAQRGLVERHTGVLGSDQHDPLPRLELVLELGG